MLRPPVDPMLASPIAEIPRRGGFVFEPKWDGFRCLVFVDPDSAEPVTLQSRNGKPLNRYFPEVLARISDGATRPAVMDGELVVVKRDALGDRLDWDALSERIHPAESRTRALAAQTPARFVAFDLLYADHSDLRGQGFGRRHAALRELEPPVHITPATEDPSVAAEWFDVFEGAGLDGIIAKDAESGYFPGKRRMLKVKHERTADCVVAGLRWQANTEPGTAVGSLLLGLHDEHGALHQVGVVSAFPASQRMEMARELPLADPLEAHPWVGPHVRDGRRLPDSTSRWRTTEQPWQPLRPEYVVEVSYDHTEGAHPARFRHTARFVRWRPDRAPDTCGYEQLDEPARYDLDAVLRGAIGQLPRSTG